MPYYVEIASQNKGTLTATCGTANIADRLANTNSDVAGNDFAYVYAFDLDVQQPHNEHGAGTVSSAPALHTVTVTVPDYEPILTGAIEILAAQDVIKQLTFNIAAIKQGSNKLLAQYVMSDGMMIDYEHIIDDQRLLDAQKQRGHVIMTFKFKQINISNKVSNSEGTITTTSQ